MIKHDDTALVLMELTHDEIKHFHDAQIPYSGENDVYIATYLRFLEKSISALQWMYFTVTRNRFQWTVTKSKRVHTLEQIAKEFDTFADRIRSYNE